MKRYIRTASILDLPEGDPFGNAVMRAESSDEIDDILFGSEDGLTFNHVLAAIRNPNTSVDTLVELAPYADWVIDSRSRFREYISCDRIPADVRRKVAINEIPKIIEFIDNEINPNSHSEYFDVNRVLECLEDKAAELGLPSNLVDTVEYYCANLKEIIESKLSNLRNSKLNRIKGEFTDFTDSNVVKYLKDNGINTSRCTYELTAQEYERYEEGEIYTLQFDCYGDWLAYLSMLLHSEPNADTIGDYMDIDDFKDLVADYPSLKDMKAHASQAWWGDGSDFIIKLKNLTTGTILYRAKP